MIIQNDSLLHEILTQSRVIAVVGHSDKPHRTSYQIADYLRQVGYTVYAVNPAVSAIDGQPCYASLADVPEAIDIVNVFRRSEYLGEIVAEAAQVGAKTVWAQLGVIDSAAIPLAEAARLNLVMDNCIKVTHRRVMS